MVQCCAIVKLNLDLLLLIQYQKKTGRKQPLHTQKWIEVLREEIERFKM